MNVVSDLHLEFGAKITWKGLDVLLVAGDATTYPRREHDLRKLRESCDRMVYVLGNHEYYEAPPDTDVVRDYANTCKDLGIQMLEDECALVGDWNVYGTTLWSTYVEMESMEDSHHVSAEFVRRKHETSKARLTTFLDSYDAPNPLLVMTHHLPSRKLIAPKYAGFVDSCFASDSDELIRRPVSVWVYGHTHVRGNTIINDVRMVCNPRGYPRENRGAYSPFVLT